MNEKKYYQKNFDGEWEEVKLKDVVHADLEKIAAFTVEELRAFVVNKRKRQREATRRFRERNKNVRKKREPKSRS